MSCDILLASLIALEEVYDAKCFDLTPQERERLGEDGNRIVVYRSDQPGWATGSLLLPNAATDDVEHHPEVIERLLGLMRANAEINKPGSM